MKRILKFYFSGKRSRSLGILACLMVAGFFEGIGMAAMIPLVTIVVGGEGKRGFGAEAMEWLIAQGIEPTLGFALTFVAVTLVTKSLLQAAAMIYVGFASAELVTELRRRVVAAMLEARWDFLLRQQAGRLSNILNSESNRAGELYVQIGMLLAIAIQTITYLCVSFAVSWQLALAGLTLGSLLGLAVRRMVSYARDYARRSVKVQRKLLSLFIESLRNAKPIKAMGREESFAAGLNKNINKYRKLQRKAALNREALSNLQDAGSALVLCGTFYPLFKYQIATGPEMVISALLLARVVNMTGKIQKAYQRVLGLESAYFTTVELIDEGEAAREVASGGDPAHFERSIRFENVELRHGESVALDDVNLEIPAGRCTVLLGPSGAGKTSIVDLVLGLYRPTRGRILVDGQPLDEIDLQSWRESVGYVPQENVLLHDTIRANVALGDPRIGEADIVRAIEMAGAADFVANTERGLDSVVGETGGALSGGERQRIALARALARRPRLLILDEVTSALDPDTARAVADQIGKLVGETTVLAITHRPEFVDVADAVYRIEKGRAVDFQVLAERRSAR
jgi:ATP-binding cassette subfamily C protein